MPEGRVIKAVGGFYYIADNNGETVVAVARGKFRRTGSILVGDIVKYELIPENQGVIEDIKPRKIVLKRPCVSNVEKIFIVFALKNPDYNRFLLDRFLLLAEASGLDIVLLLNKKDLVTKTASKKAAEPYNKIGYRVICTSAVTREGKRLLLRELSGNISVLSGPSGVGKSALLNMINPEYSLDTGEVSPKIGRGRHTTRLAQLLPLPNRPGYILDTPGFTQFDLDFIDLANLDGFFPDLARWKQNCRFPGCLHMKEPDCGVKEAVDKGDIYPWRYEHYLRFAREIREFDDNKYRRKKRS